MAIIGLGTDIVEIERFDNKNLAALAQRILTPNELAIFNRHKQPIRYLAKRWAAKEAAAKALGTGIAKGVTFHNFEVSSDQNGAPVITLSGVAAQRAGQQTKAWITLSDEKNYAVATVILEML
ncbi:holo-ACP synthase [Gayadomonas joobiniege]|uniref:holo-ACP synthase n=1 Tax=Gayadomonas joobiniege TaxID=1234606 RepID=UPI0003800B51|nr:holo-ACP synthase [Gayadomonas joobiniege]